MKNLFSLTLSIPHNMSPGCSKTSKQMLAELSALAKQIEATKPKGPRIDDNTILRGGLALFSQRSDEILQLESKINNKVYWSGLSDESLYVINSSDYKIKFDIPDKYKPEPKHPWDNIPQNMLPKRLRRQPLKLEGRRWSLNYMPIITYPTYDSLIKNVT